MTFRWHNWLYLPIKSRFAYTRFKCLSLYVPIGVAIYCVIRWQIIYCSKISTTPAMTTQVAMVWRIDLHDVSWLEKILPKSKQERTDWLWQVDCTWWWIERHRIDQLTSWCLRDSIRTLLIATLHGTNAKQLLSMAAKLPLRLQMFLIEWQVNKFSERTN